MVGLDHHVTRNDYAKRTAAGCRSVEDHVQAIAEFTAGLGASVDWEDLDAIVLGGTEEEIIVRGSDWCTDVARVACGLCQVNGIPARLVCLFDTLRAYSGHFIVEAYRSAVWGAVGSSTAVVYRHPDRRPASAWELIHDPEVVDHHRRPGATTTKADQFRGAAISGYFLWERDKYNYTVSGDQRLLPLDSGDVRSRLARRPAVAKWRGRSGQ